MNDVYDLYEDKTRVQNNKTIVLIHGGAWLFGHKEKYRQHGYMLSNIGYRVVIPNYEKQYPSKIFKIFTLSLIPCFILPNHNRIKSSIIIILLLIIFPWIVLFLISLSHPYEYDPYAKLENICAKVYNETQDKDNHKFFLIGHSAGAHLAGLLLYRYPIWSGFVGISGIYSAKRLTSRLPGRLIMNSIWNSPNKFPLLNVQYNQCPVFLINARWDFDLIMHTFDYIIWLKQNNVKTWYKMIPSTHISIMNWRKNGVHLLIHDFFNSVIKCKSSS